MPLCARDDSCPPASNPLTLSWCCRPIFYKIVDSDVAGSVVTPSAPVIPATLLRQRFMTEYGASWEIWKDAYINGRGITEEIVTVPPGIEVAFWTYPLAPYAELNASRLTGCAPITPDLSGCRPAVGYG